MLAHLARTAIRGLLWLGPAALLAGCASAPTGPVAPAASGEADAATVAPPGTRAFDIDPERTTVTMLVYRAGPLARLGHNHAITSDTESGQVWLGTSPKSSGFEIRVPVAAMVVDDPQARAAAGAEFPGTVPDDARAGTRANMLRAEVLDAEHFPEIIVRCSGAEGTWQQVVVHAAVRLKGVERNIDVPVALDVTNTLVTAKGAFQIRQTDFGITPFSVAGGAIQVADPVDVRFVITAVARPKQ
jgi:polyisoprenoid-binding protein YceI